MKKLLPGAIGSLCIFLLASCSSSMTVGSATTGQSSATTTHPVGSGTSFDSCKDLSDVDITSFGLDPATRKVTSVQQANLGTGCSWTDKQVEVGFLVTDQTTDALAARAAFMNVKNFTVDGRQAVQFELEVGRDCNVGVATQATAVVVSLGINFSSIGSVDPCATALTIATKLAPALPR